MAASKLFGGCLQASGAVDAHHGAHGRPADFYFQRLIGKVSEQGNKLLQVLEQMGEEKARMAREVVELNQERERLAHAKKELLGEMEKCERTMAEERSQMREETAERERRLAEERSHMREEIAEFREACEQEVAVIARRAEEDKAQAKMDCDQRLEEASRRAAELGADCDRRLEEGATRLAECQAGYERKLAEERIEMTKQTGAFLAEEMARRMSEWQVDRERLERERAQERAQMLGSLADLRAASERRTAEEEAAAARRMAGLREECERQVAEERTAGERRLSEVHERSEEQLRAQRQATAHVMHVLRELPPLQTAMELGDIRLLEDELAKWCGAVLPERFGACGGVVEAVLKLARDRLATWRAVERTWKDVLSEAEHLSGGLVALTQQGQRVFRVLKEAQLTKMDLRRSDPDATERICQVLLAWQECAMLHSNAVQRLIVNKVVKWPELGTFDFADLDICLRLADRRECRGDVFLSRAQALVEDEATAPRDLRALLAHLETVLYFLKYARSEDLGLAHAEFRRQPDACPLVLACLRHAEREYPPGAELVRLEGRDLLDRGDAAGVLRELRAPSAGGGALAAFREIFYQWALAMHRRFGLLVLPHHAQVLCLLAFAHFLQPEEAPGGPRTLIAQVGTGEGKSMIVAALAIYVVVALGKKAHVIMDDEVLLERDFWTFKRVFEAFEVASPAAGSSRRPLSAVLCVSEERLARAKGDPCLAARLDPDADICYCEAKHVQSHYAGVARGGGQDFDAYEQCVLILDEVDALVIDEEPNEAFVYPNAELSELATLAAGALARGASPEAAEGSAHPAAGRVAAEMAREWAGAGRLVPGEDFEYVRETGRYCALHAGRADPKAWSLALECRNFQDGLSRKILFQERLFVMSRPRVFRKYHRILGLSGSIGSRPEQGFLKDTYCAAFMTVPPFLKTCKGSPFHEAVPVRLGERQRPVYVEPTQEAQLLRVAELALRARERVPVLVIARDRRHADLLVQHLRQAACSQGLGAFGEDVVRSLSRTLYEADGEQWKENLNRATLPLGDGAGGNRSWRITVTDPRGGRGTDYRVDDHGVDSHGGLLLIPTWVPTSRREWTQFLGRTARQDCRGQFCCALCAADYAALSAKYRQPLPADGGLDVVERILSWGDREAAERIRASAALYNSGLRVNELCEEVFGRRRALLEDPAGRERLVEVCQRFRWMSVREVDLALGRAGLDAARVPSAARDLGRPAEPPGAAAAPAARGAPGAGAPRAVAFCLDRSASMQSRDTGTALSRFETCAQCLRGILRGQVRDADTVAVVAFGSDVQVVAPPTPAGAGGRAALEATVAGLRPQAAGGTCFFDAVARCLQLLGQPEAAPAGALPWLVCLTDGDDLGSQPRNSRGQLVTGMLEAGIPARLNMVMITVGTLKAANVQLIDSWVARAQAAGGLARHLPERDAATIAKAFDVVAECLATEVGGSVEC